MPDYKFTIGDYSTKPPLPKNILTGQRFGRLLVIGYAGRTKRGSSNRAIWHCLCDCKNGRTVFQDELISKKIRSCGCWQKESRYTHTRTHGHAVGFGSREYKSYQHAKQRCENPNVSSYPRYGGRGIEFRFNSFEEFFAELGEMPPKYTLDRIDNDGHYEKGNVRWATYGEQMRNKCSTHLLTHDNKTQCLSDWANEVHLNSQAIRNRLKKGWCTSCALTEPRYTGTCPHKIISLSRP